MQRYLTATCILVLVTLGMLTLALSSNAERPQQKSTDSIASTPPLPLTPLTKRVEPAIVSNNKLPITPLYAMQLPSATNVALASNGAVASASSAHISGQFPVAAVNNGDRKAMNWGSGGGWNDNTQGDYSSDVVQINFPNFTFVNQINVFTLRTNYQDNLTQPTLTETFSTCENAGYGITEFEVQYWNSAMWVTVPGGIVRDNNKVWRQFTFPEVWASAIRVQVHGAVRFTIPINYSRIVEIEAFGRAAGFNIAAVANGSTATASSELTTAFPVSAVNDGDRTGFNWGRGGFGSGWADATENEYSIDWVRANFLNGQARRISEIDVYTLRDGFSTKTDDPSINETFNTADNTGQGMTDYDVQYLAGTIWKTIPGGKVTGNNKVRRQFRFSPINTSAIRVAVNKGVNYTTVGNNWSRLVEIEAWENAALPDDVVWVEDALPTGAIPNGSFEGWNWTCSNPLPLSGTLAHASDLISGVHQHFFSNATQTLTVNTGDTLVAHVYLDPVNPPTQVMLQWNDGTWEHRAYWGASQIPWGVEGTVSRRNMGALPPAGQWVRLEVPASLVGLEGRTLNGMAFTLFNGKATWDHGGKFAASGSPTQPSISINDVTISEGNSGTTLATFNVTLSNSSTQTVTVNYATANVTATAGSDYSTASGTVTFLPGEVSKPVAVAVFGETAVESNETFVVNLSGPANATLADSQGVGTILNDDVPPPATSISIGDATVIEGSCGGTPRTVFNVTLSAASTQNVSVNYATANGTASSASDYIAASGTFTIPAGSTSGTINILARSDTTIEGDETFFVNLSNPVNATIADGQSQAIIKNDDTTPPPLGNPGSDGQWAPCEDLETVPVHINLLPDGRLLYWGRDKHPDTWDTAGSCNTYTWHPVTKVKSGAMPTAATNLFCSAHSFLPDGRLLVAGGHDRDSMFPDQELIGERELNIFNFQNSTWTLSSKQMQNGRWYPSSVILGNGEVSIFSGTYWDGTRQGGVGRPIIKKNLIPDFYNESDQIFPGGDTNDIRNYPYLHLAADGRVFGIAGKAPWFYSRSAGQFSVVFPGPPRDHFEGSSVLYNTEQGKVMIVGGREGGSTGPSLSDVTIFDIASQTFSVGPSMNFKRQYHNTTLLPDGKVLASGGQKCDGAVPSAACADGAAHIPEIWSPATNAWTRLAENPMRTPRLYHSIALLLPDGRVLIGGGGLPAAGGDVVVDTTNNTVVTCSGRPTNDPVACRHYGHTDVEIFSPPYLFQGNGTPAARPTINSAPASVNLGETFNVSISSGTQVNSAVLMRLPSVTHGLNFDQRRVVLPLQVPSTTNLTLTIPNQPNICPPGYYMLFVMNSAGVPSVSKFIKVTVPGGPVTFPLFDTGSRMTRNLDGRLQVFYKGADNALYYFVQTAAGASTWVGPINLGGIITSNPVAIANADGRIEVFAKGTDNAIYHQWQLSAGSNSWSGWAGLSGSSAAGDPAVARNTNGKLQVIYRGGDNLLYTIAQTVAGANSWTMPTNLFGTLISDPAVGVNADGRLEVFAVMSDNGLHHIWQTSAGSSTWSSWFGFGGFLDSNKPDVSRNADGLLQVFYREAGGMGAGVFYLKQSPGSPGGWTNHTSIGGTLGSAPTIGINSDGRLEVFGRATDNTLHHVWQTVPSGSSWSAWTSLGGGLTSGAAPAQNANGRLSVVVRGLDNALYYNVQSTPGNSSWAGFVRLGGNASSF